MMVPVLMCGDYIAILAGGDGQAVVGECAGLPQGDKRGGPATANETGFCSSCQDFVVTSFEPATAAGVQISN